jgi:hypothetical protein
MRKCREVIGRWLLKNGKSPVVSRNLEPASVAKSAAILFKSSVVSAEDFKHIQNFFLSWGIKPYFYMYFDDKNKETPTSSHKKEYFDATQLNFWCLPKLEFFDKFVNQNFDYWINLDTDGSLPIQALSFHSKAKIRIAKRNKTFCFCNDFFVETETEKPIELFNLIEEFIK